jgi:predicted protein tyrosine phosphatase
MLESVVITSLNTAVSQPYRENLIQNLWITTVDPEDERKARKLNAHFKRIGVSHFVQYFRDWSDEDEETYIKNNIEEQGPREQHINNIISFLDPYVSSSTPYHLGVNCFAGISRSTAIGIIAWIMQGFTPEEALEKILAVRSVAWPNLRMLRMASVRLGKNIMTPVADWKIKENGKLVYEL